MDSEAWTKRNGRIADMNGVDGNARDKDGRTALQMSAMDGHKGIVELLIRNGAKEVRQRRS